VNEPQTDAELAALRESVRRGCPFGAADWQTANARALNLKLTFRKCGPPAVAAREIALSPLRIHEVCFRKRLYLPTPTGGILGTMPAWIVSQSYCPMEPSVDRSGEGRPRFLR
jgi:hypothetical protein